MKSNEIKSIGFALDPSGIPAFLLDWEVTKKCNLDCSYCGTSVETGGHIVGSQHPSGEECIKTIDFMYEYVDLYMQHKRPKQKKVVLNVYGGESLFHPDIVKILTAAREKYEPYADSWELTIITTTNAVINKSIWKKIIPLIDEFTVSYHAENLPKHERLFFDNLLELKRSNKRFKCIVMMHNDSALWPKSINAIEFCNQQGIRTIPKPIDQGGDTDLQGKFEYTKEQFNYITKQSSLSDKVVSICEGRACCGGRKLSLNNDLKSSVNFVPKQGFKGWSCSVNWFFVYITQYTGDVYLNRDCRMRFDGSIGPIGNLKDTRTMISTLKTQLENKSMPVIQCAKSVCRCGYCAPKAQDINDFKDLMGRHVVTDVISYE